MKVNSFSQIFRNAIASSKSVEGDGGNGQNFYERQQQQRQGHGQGDPQQETPIPPHLVAVTPQQIEAAVEDFRKDQSMQAHGLSAVIEGAGPGLRIAVRDTNGATVRQFTREEFVRLRSIGSAKDTHPRGKILDQKL
jgi:hypothetical protein